MANRGAGGRNGSGEVAAVFGGRISIATPSGPFTSSNGRAEGNGARLCILPSLIAGGVMMTVPLRRAEFCAVAVRHNPAQAPKRRVKMRIREGFMGGFPLGGSALSAITRIHVSLLQ